MKTTRHRGKTIDRVSGVKVIDCTACGFKHVVPFPSEEKLKELYEKEFYEHDKPNYFSETREDKEWWMATYASYFGGEFWI
jgi:hypothetical protein